MITTSKKVANCLYLSILLVLLSGCGNELVKTTQVGKIVSIEDVQVGWKENLRSRVITTKGSYVVVGQFSVTFDTDAWINEYDNGNSYLCMTGKEECYYVKVN